MERTLDSDRACIVALYAHRQPTYRFADVLALLGISDAQLHDAITRGVIATETNDIGERVIGWAEVATLALDEWTPRMIEAALHHEPSDIIPLLNQHRLIRVSLPVYLIRLLDHLARVESATRHVPRNASDIIERVLHDFANTQNTAAIDAESPDTHRHSPTPTSYRAAPASCGCDAGTAESRSPKQCVKSAAPASDATSPTNTSASTDSPNWRNSMNHQCTRRLELLGIASQRHPPIASQNGGDVPRPADANCVERRALCYSGGRR